MNKFHIAIFAITLLTGIVPVKAQDYMSEIGLGIGNVVGSEHTLGKAEIFANVFKPLKTGQLGLDFTAGGNFIPGDRSTMEGNTETLSPNDIRYHSATVVYRYPIKKRFFIEPRLGYSSLSYFVHTDEDRKISEPNFSYGLSMGATVLDKFSVSIRYQYLGMTPETFSRVSRKLPNS